MLRSTLRQMASISGRAILAIGLTSATVLALAPSAKADDNGVADNLKVNNPVILSIAYTKQSATVSTAGSASFTGADAGSLGVVSNDELGFTIKATSANAGYLAKGDPATTAKAAYELKVLDAAGVTGTKGYLPINNASVGVLVFDTTANLTTATGQAASLPVNIQSVTGVDFTLLPSGIYKDTVTFAIAGKS